MSDEAVPDALVARPVHWTRPWIIGLLYWLVLIPLTIPPRHSGNVWSRYLTAESIVERGTLAIERSPLLRTSGSPDVIKVGRHLYSDKPPVLSALAAILYLPAAIAGVRFSGSPDQFIRLNLLLVSGIVGVCSALTLVWLRQLLQLAPLSRLVADLLTLGFGFGSLLLTYGVTFNNHSVAAGLLTGALAMVALERGHRLRKRRFAAGLLAGVAAVVDLPAGGALLAGLAIWLTIRSRGVPWSYLAGCSGPLLLHAVLQTMVTGSPLPAEMTPEVFLYEGSYWMTEAGRWEEAGPRWQFGLELLFGTQGWLTVTPVLAFGLIELIRTLRKPHDPLRPLSTVVSATVVVLLAYYIWGVRRTDFAGQSFGVRHLLPITPACYLFSCVALGRWRNRFANVTFALLLGIGMVFAVAGMLDPWSRVERRNDAAIVAVRWLALYPWSSYDR